MSEKNIFKANPYNLSNKLIQKNDIDDIMNTLNIIDFVPNDIKLYQKSIRYDITKIIIIVINFLCALYYHGFKNSCQFCSCL